MKNRTVISLLFFILLSVQSFGQKDTNNVYKIQIALILDVSGSMNGLISQAKGQIWRMVNELATAEKKGKTVKMQIALSSYGNITFQNNSYFRLHAPLTADLDLISEQLFDLTIEGGSEEYCGYAIQAVLDSLDWSKNKQDLKIIFIAGNEQFSKGGVNYSKACKQANKKQIIINTIYCGTVEEGIYNFWADGAKRGKGKYLTINQDSTIKLTETVWDKKIIYYNDKLNSTYVPYGRDGDKLKQRQIRQDENALLLGNSLLRDRVIFKITDKYQNEHWDLVDAYKQDSLIFTKLKPDQLPEGIRNMSYVKKIKYLKQKEMERELYKEGAQVYYNKAQEFLEMSTGNTKLTLTLENSIINTIKQQGKKKNFKFK